MIFHIYRKSVMPMNTLIETANSLLWGRFTVALILCCGIYHTVKSGFIQLKLPKHLFSSDGKNRLGAVTSALAASLGTGNITGCAAAIAAGGAGAVFWMWLSALGGMALAYSENRIGAEFGEKYPKSARGPMLYIEKGMGAKWLAAAYAVCCLGAAIFMGSMSQSGALSDALSAQTPLPRYICSLAAAVVTAAVLFSSDRAAEGVMKFSARIVPVMGLLYAGGCIGLLIISKCDVSGAFADIFSQAFSLKAAAGGAAGITVKKAVSVGLRRGIFSNEAGMGSSVLVHSEADFGEPQSAGAWAAFEVFLDTGDNMLQNQRHHRSILIRLRQVGRRVRVPVHMYVCPRLGAGVELLRGKMPVLHHGKALRKMVQAGVLPCMRRRGIYRHGKRFRHKRPFQLPADDNKSACDNRSDHAQRQIIPL